MDPARPGRAPGGRGRWGLAGSGPKSSGALPGGGDREEGGLAGRPAGEIPAGRPLRGDGGPGFPGGRPAAAGGRVLRPARAAPLKSGQANPQQL